MYDALAVEACNLEDDWLSHEEEVYVQVIQDKYVEEVEVYTCTLEKTLTVGYCKLYSLSLFINYWR